MEYQLLRAVTARIAALDPSRPRRGGFRDAGIARVYYWAVLCDRPTAWACVRAHWPVHLRKGPLPSQPTVSRRLRPPRVVALLEALDRRVTRPTGPGLFWMIDGKPLPVGGWSTDKRAGYGRAAGTKAEGYKLHAPVGADGSVAGWRVAPMNTDERVMAERLLKAAPPAVVGDAVGDANSDPNRLHRACDAHGDRQLVPPRRYGPGNGAGHREQAPGRVRSMARVGSPVPALADQLRRDRAEVERRSGSLVNWGGGLSGRPAWVRTHRRARRWVQAKLVLTRLKRGVGFATCEA